MKLVYNVCLLLTCVPLEAESSLIRARPWTVPVSVTRFDFAARRASPYVGTREPPATRHAPPAQDAVYGTTRHTSAPRSRVWRPSDSLP